jgi:tRNA(fMet)-specific endonuclease VapC
MTSGAEPPIRRLVLDTSAYSWLRGGHQAVLDLVAAAQIVIVPVTVLGELEAGFELGGRQRENRATLADFLAEPFVTVGSPSADTARRYGELFAHLRRAGTPVPINDIWIAAICLDCGGHLLTFDRHFERFPSLPATVLAQP